MKMLSRHDYVIGTYTVQTEWKNGVLYFDVFQHGTLAATGFDRLSLTESMAVDAIKERILGKVSKGQHGSN